MHDKYLIADGKRYILGGRNTYNYFLGDFPGHKNYDRDVLVVCDEPEKENSVNQLLEYFETIWEQEDSGYFHDNKKLANRKSVKNAVLELLKALKITLKNKTKKKFSSHLARELLFLFVF